MNTTKKIFYAFGLAMLITGWLVMTIFFGRAYLNGGVQNFRINDFHEANFEAIMITITIPMVAYCIHKTLGWMKNDK